jgi:hypothetical protein
MDWSHVVISPGVHYKVSLSGPAGVQVIHCVFQVEGKSNPHGAVKVQWFSKIQVSKAKNPNLFSRIGVESPWVQQTVQWYPKESVQSVQH